jgi:hypothetical protein
LGATGSADAEMACSTRCGTNRTAGKPLPSRYSGAVASSGMLLEMLI